LLKTNISGDGHALAQSAEQFKRQGLLYRSHGSDRVSGSVDRSAGFAFSRVKFTLSIPRPGVCHLVTELGARVHTLLRMRASAMLAGREVDIVVAAGMPRSKA
jgi:hypothetical protein